MGSPAPRASKVRIARLLFSLSSLPESCPHACVCARRRHRGPGHRLATRTPGPPGHGDRPRDARSRCQRRQRRATQLFVRAAAGRSVDLEATAQAAALAHFAAQAAAAARSAAVALGHGLPGRLQRADVARHHGAAARAGGRKPRGLRVDAGRHLARLRFLRHRQAGAVCQRSIAGRCPRASGAAAHHGQRTATGDARRMHRHRTRPGRLSRADGGRGLHAERMRRRLPQGVRRADARPRRTASPATTNASPPCAPAAATWRPRPS